VKQRVLTRVTHTSEAPFRKGTLSRIFNSRLAALTGAILAGLFAQTIHAATPPLDYVFPAGGQQGMSVSVNAGGKFDPWPAKVWIDCPGIEFKAETNNGQFTAQIAKDAPVGPHFIRTYNPDGASAPRWFMVTARTEVLEKEPNDNSKQAQAIAKLPVTINGKLEKNGDVDCFAVNVEAGKWLVAQVDAYSLGSPVDALLHVMDTNGVRLAFNHDSAQSLDPLLAFKVPKTGTYVVMVAGFVHPPAAEIRYAGSAATVYRLTITDGPYADYVFPPSVRRGEKAPLQLLGWNLEKAELIFDASQIALDVGQAIVDAPGTDGRLKVLVSDLPGQNEVEPNDKPADAKPISPPCAVNGRLDPAGDEDCFSFKAKKGERFDVIVRSASLGFPPEVSLRIEDSAGKSLARDGGSVEADDPKLAWTAPEDGSYVVAVRDLFRKGGPDYVYRLEIAPPRPDFNATVTEHAIRVQGGKTNELKINVALTNNYTNRLVVVVKDLPAGVIAKETEVPAKGGEVKVALIADPEIKAASQPIRVMVQTVDAAPVRSKAAVFDLKGGKDARGDKLINGIDRLWITVLDASAQAPAEETKKKKKK